MNRTIRIWFVDFPKKWNKEENFISAVLKNHYDIILDEKDPEFVFCSTFGSDYLRYSCVRIFYTGEAICPDFNLYDYAIGFDPMQYGDRYLQYPLCLVDETTLEKVKKKHLRSDEELLERKKFCNYVVSAGGGFRGMRDQIYDEISKYRTVDSGGRYRNNLPDGKGVEDKLAFQREYRFTLAPENTVFPGYVTEKIMDAWAAGTIPIYWGAPEITKLFNPEAFICIENNDFEKARQRVQEVNEDEALYLKMQHAPVFTESSPLLQLLEKDALTLFLCSILEQPVDQAYRRNSRKSMIGVFYEYRLGKWARWEKNKFYLFLRNTKRKYFGLKKIKGV